MGLRLLFGLAVGAAALTAAAQEHAATASRYAPGTVLVVASDKYPFAAVEIGSGIQGAEVVELTLIEAMREAKANPNVSGVIDINLSTDSAFERGRVVCYDRTGRKAWEERVMFNLGGSADRIAEKFSARLAEKVRGKACP